MSNAKIKKDNHFIGFTKVTLGKFIEHNDEVMFLQGKMFDG